MGNVSDVLIQIINKTIIYTHDYSYDGLNRLTEATGEWEGHSSHTEAGNVSDVLIYH